MGFFANLFGRNKKVENQQDLRFILRDFVEEVATQEENSALKLSAVYSAISTISNTMSKIPFYIYNKKTKERMEDENLYSLLNLQPNDKMTSPVMNKLLSWWSLIYGEAYVIPVRNRSTRISQLVPVNPTMVTKEINDSNQLLYVVKNNKGGETKYRYDEIIHLKDMTLDGINGISRLDFAKKTISTGLNQEKYTEDFYKNYGRPLDYLKTQANLSNVKQEVSVQQPDGTTKKEFKSGKDIMREEWEKAHKGKNRFAIAILDNGLEYDTVPQITPEQMEFVSSKTVNVEDIARFFDMASCSFKLGIGKQTYSNNEQGQICYVTETIVPRLKQWETELTLKVLTKAQIKEGWMIKGNIAAELRGDMITQANYYEKMLSNGIYTINDCLDLEDRKGIGELGDKRFIGPNRIPLEKLAEGETAGDVTPNPIKENGDE